MGNCCCMKGLFKGGAISMESSPQGCTPGSTLLSTFLCQVKTFCMHFLSHLWLGVLSANIRAAFLKLLIGYWGMELMWCLGICLLCFYTLVLIINRSAVERAGFTSAPALSVLFGTSEGRSEGNLHKPDIFWYTKKLMCIGLCFCWSGGGDIWSSTFPEDLKTS